jgi:hypothetical protein
LVPNELYTTKAVPLIVGIGKGVMQAAKAMRAGAGLNVLAANHCTKVFNP